MRMRRVNIFIDYQKWRRAVWEVRADLEKWMLVHLLVFIMFLIVSAVWMREVLGLS